MHPPHLAALADRHGLLTLDSWIAGGRSPDSWYRAIASGRVNLVHQGVARLPGASSSTITSIAAAVLAGGVAALVSHRSAAVLWDALDPDGSAPHIVVPRNQRSPTTSAITVHRPTDRLDLRSVRREGIAVCNPLRLVVDLGAAVPLAEVQLAVERLVVQRLVTVGALRGALARHARKGHQGVEALRRALDDRALGRRPSDSTLEETFASMVRRYGLPAPTFHPTVVLDGTAYVPDFTYHDARVVIEIDGFEFHSSRTSFESDRARDAHFAAHGWLPARFTWLQIVRTPGVVARRLGDILRRRAMP